MILMWNQGFEPLSRTMSHTMCPGASDNKLLVAAFLDFLQYSCPHAMPLVIFLLTPDTLDLFPSLLPYSHLCIIVDFVFFSFHLRNFLSFYWVLKTLALFYSLAWLIPGEWDQRVVIFQHSMEQCETQNHSGVFLVWFKTVSEKNVTGLWREKSMGKAMVQMHP